MSFLIVGVFAKVLELQVFGITFFSLKYLLRSGMYSYYRTKLYAVCADTDLFSLYPMLYSRSM